MWVYKKFSNSNRKYSKFDLFRMCRWLNWISFMGFRHLCFRPIDRDLEKVREAVSQGLSWSICMVWLRINPGKISVWIEDFWDRTEDSWMRKQRSTIWATAIWFVQIMFQNVVRGYLRQHSLRDYSRDSYDILGSPMN